MATASKTAKLSPKAAAAVPKVAPRAAVKKKPIAAAAPAKPRQPKGTASKATAPKPTAVKAAAPALRQRARSAPAPAKPQISPQQRQHYIEVAAYFIAERRGFPTTNALDNWTQAEAEIDRMLGEGKVSY